MVSRLSSRTHGHVLTEEIRLVEELTYPRLDVIIKIRTRLLSLVLQGGTKIYLKSHRITYSKKWLIDVRSI